MNFDFSKIDLKKVDKKVWACIGAGAVALVLVIVLIIVAVSGNSDDGKDSQAGSQKPGSQQTGSQKPGSEDSESEKPGSESLGTEGIETEDTEVTEIKGTETESTEIEGGENGDSQSPGTNNGTSGGSNTSGTESSEPEEGSKELPIGLVPNDNFIMETTAIEAGKSLYFNVYRTGGMTVTIEDADAYVVYNGTRYDATGGKIVFTIENVLADHPVLFEIGNKGSAKKAFTLKWAAKKGTYENPDTVSNLNGSQIGLHIEEDNEEGYIYLYTAEKAGTIKLTLLSASNNAKVCIKVINKTSSEEKNLENDGVDGSLELKVKAGDVIEISLYARPNDDWEYPATDVAWKGEYK